MKLATTMCMYLIPLNCTLKIDKMQTLCCIYFTTMKKIKYFKWKEIDLIVSAFYVLVDSQQGQRDIGTSPSANISERNSLICV